MMGAPNSLNLNCKVRVMKEAPGPSVSEEIADIFRSYDIDNGLLPGLHQAIMWTSARILLIRTLACLGKTSLESSEKLIHFHSKKYFWKCHLWNGVNIVSASICKILWPNTCNGHWICCKNLPTPQWLKKIWLLTSHMSMGYSKKDITPLLTHWS